MNFHGIFVFGLMAIVLFSISSQGTNALFGNWKIHHAKTPVKSCKKDDDCNDDEICNRSRMGDVCTYVCSDMSCDKSEICTGKNHKFDCDCAWYQKHKANKCESPLEFDWIPNWFKQSMD